MVFCSAGLGVIVWAPFFAGAIALYLEKFPTANYEQRYAAFLAGAESDSLTLSDGALPNKTWGYGRLTIFKAMDGVSAVEENKNAITACDVTIYPNPSTHTITFETQMTASRRQELSIFDAVGNRMRTLDLSDDNRTLDVSDMTKGVYHYRLYHGNDCCSGSFVVE